MYKVLCAVLAFIIGLLSSLGVVICSDKGESVLVASYSNITVDGAAEINAEFDATEVNTVVIELKNAKSALIEIYSSGSLLYSREGTEQTRFCAFKTLATDNLTVKIIGDDVRIKSAEICLKRGDLSSFRVTSYFVAPSITVQGSVKPESFEVITDAILFSCVTFNAEGKLNVDRPLLETALENLRAAIGSRSVNIFVNVLGPDTDSGAYADWYDYIDAKAALHTAAFKTGKLEGSIAALLEEYGFDGVFFDYEYPIKQKNWRSFSDFLVSLNKKTDKKIGLALADWDIGLSLSAVKAVDMFEMMEYDLFNEQGHHADFDAAVKGIKNAKNYFLPDEKIDLGVPFYGRPADGSAVWYDYRQYAQAMGKSSDFAVAADGKDAYFNSWQTVYDKTAYAVSCGIGGMMVWHYSCDVFSAGSDLSLFGAMGECIADRSAE